MVLECNLPTLNIISKFCLLPIAHLTASSYKYLKRIFLLQNIILFHTRRSFKKVHLKIFTFSHDTMAHKSKLDDLNVDVPSSQVIQLQKRYMRENFVALMYLFLCFFDWLIALSLAITSLPFQHWKAYWRVAEKCSGKHPSIGEIRLVLCLPFYVSSQNTLFPWGLDALVSL